MAQLYHKRCCRRGATALPTNSPFMYRPSLSPLLAGITNGSVYGSYSAAFPNITEETYQPIWDAFGRFIQPSASLIPWQMLNGNHGELRGCLWGLPF